MEFLFQYASFMKVSDMPDCCGSSCLEEFVQNEIIKKEGSYLLSQLSNMYILLGDKGSEKYLKSHETKWEELLDPVLLDNITKNGSVILGYLVVCDTTTDVNGNHYIEYICSRLPGYQLARFMINRYEQKYMPKRGNYNDSTYLLPRVISNDTVGYWERYLGIYDINTANDIVEFMQENQIVDGQRDWGALHGKLLKNDRDCI